jgi:hypothetical protein
MDFKGALPDCDVYLKMMPGDDDAQKLKMRLIEAAASKSDGMQSI